MLLKPLAQLSLADIHALVRDEVREGKEVDFKFELPDLAQGQKKKELLADLSSFANASGGHIIFGIEEKKDAAGKNTGIAGRVAGLASINQDQLLLQIESIVRSGLKPRTPVHFRFLGGGSDPLVFVAQIPKSFRCPHMIAFEDDGRFWSRNSAGKYRLDVDELRDVFLGAHALPARVRAFRDERTAQILSGETPVPLESTSAFVAHVIPLDAWTSQTSVDVTALDSDHDLRNSLYVLDVGHEHRLNFDGLLVWTRINERASEGYVQLFRSGIVEAVSTVYVGDLHGRRALRIDALEAGAHGVVDRIPAFLQGRGVDPPYIILFSLLDVRGVEIPMPAHRAAFPGRTRTIDRDSLLLPEILIEELPIDIDPLIKPAFDTLWQSAGYKGSLNFKDGRWQTR